MRVQRVQALKEKQDRENKMNQAKGKENEGQMQEVPFSIQDHKMMKDLQKKLKLMSERMKEEANEFYEKKMSMNFA